MLTGHYFRRLPHHRSAASLAGAHAFLRQLSDRIVARFARFSPLPVLIVQLDLAPDGDVDEATPATHSACADFADTGYCRESWQLHLGQLAQRPESHWHRCDYGRLCAAVPLVCGGRCLVAFKLVCDESMSEANFKRHVELLDMVVENAVLGEAKALSRLFPDEPVRYDAGSGAAAVRRGKPSGGGLSRSQVIKAIEYIEHALSDHELTVSQVARKVGLHSSYLAHLFAEQVGQRMSRYIACRRIERAKNLLVTTNWSIERVATRSGFANPKWFYHVFHTHTGQTPARYRQRHRDSRSDEVSIS